HGCNQDARLEEARRRDTSVKNISKALLLSFIGEKARQGKGGVKTVIRLHWVVIPQWHRRRLPCYRGSKAEESWFHLGPGTARGSGTAADAWLFWGSECGAVPRAP